MILLDDIGWGDPSYNNGTTYTPYLDAWTKEANTITFHRGYAGVCDILFPSILLYFHNSICFEQADEMIIV